MIGADMRRDFDDDIARLHREGDDTGEKGPREVDEHRLVTGDLVQPERAEGRADHLRSGPLAGDLTGIGIIRRAKRQLTEPGGGVGNHSFAESTDAGQSFFAAKNARRRPYLLRLRRDCAVCA